MDIRVISIGTLAANPLWGEKGPVRVGHATCTLIRDGKRAILVDPGLPQQVLLARLNERAGLTAKDITHVFLTRYTREHTRGVLAFEHATWWINHAEREGAGVPLVADLTRAAAEGDEDVKAALELDVAVLRRCETAPDRVSDHVALFPLPGVSPGLCGLLVEGRGGKPGVGVRGVGAAGSAGPVRGGATLLITGDAVATAEHLERGMVLIAPGTQGPAGDVNYQRARESFAEAVEIADVLIPGRDNLVVNPVRRPF